MNRYTLTRVVLALGAIVALTSTSGAYAKWW